MQYTNPASGVAGANGGAVVQQQMPMTGMNMTNTVMQHDDAHGGGGDHHSMGPELKAPERNDPRFLAGTTGPKVKKGKAPNVKIPDGPGFGGIKGRKQNDGDKKQNDYSTTDANFYPTLGLLPKDPDTGKTMTYVQHIQSYNAAGYIQTFAPDVYAKLVENQNAGKGTVLGGSLYLMGIVNKPDPAAAGLNPSQVPNQIPGTPLNAKKVVMSGTDISGQQWARPHHAESAWPVFKQLLDAGVDYKHAALFSGDDAISGAGRMNGMNNQDGKTGLNADERAVYHVAAEYQKKTGKQVLQIMAGGHHHTTLDQSAKTDPKINKIIGFPKGADGNDPARVNAIANAFLTGKIGDEGDAKKQYGKMKDKNTKAYSAVAGASGGGAPDKSGKADGAKGAGPESSKGGGGSMPPANATMPPMSGCSMDMMQGAGAVAGANGGGAAADAGAPVANAVAGATGGGGPDVSAQLAQILTALVQALQQLVAILSQQSAVQGGGPDGKTPTQTPAQTPTQSPLQGGGGCGSPTKGGGGMAAPAAPAPAAQPTPPPAAAMPGMDHSTMAHH